LNAFGSAGYIETVHSLLYQKSPTFNDAKFTQY